MLLAVDVGNTTIGLGVYDGDRLCHVWHLATHPVRTADEYGMLLLQLLTQHRLTAGDISAAVLSCVAPPVLDAFVEATRRYLGCDPLLISVDLDLGLNVMYQPPHAVGTDRLANAVAAKAMYGRPVIAVDLGTATKLEVVSAAGEYLGGAIAPGVGTSLEALFERAAKLPRLNLDAPVAAVGRDTLSAMRAGIVLGTVGEVDTLVRSIKEEIQEPHAHVVATGGYAHILRGRSAQVQTFNPLSTLDGLRLIYERNSGTAR